MTAVTVQNTLGVAGVHPVPPAIVAAQIEAALSDIGADAVKTGMLGSAEMAGTVAAALERHAPAIPLVVDPVMVAKGGARLIDEDAVAALKTRLLPLAALVTPNLPEAEALTGILPVDDNRVRDAARAFAAMGARNVLFKGGHGDGEIVRDVLWAGGDFIVFEATRQHTSHTHGTGCTLATAIAGGLAQGLPLSEAVRRAHAYVQDAIRTAPRLGHGHGPLNHR